MTFIASNPRLGVVDLSTVTTQAPGVGSLPSVTLEPQLGEIVSGWDSTLGYAEFIYLKIPASSTYSVGNLITWTTSAYASAVLPALATSKNTLSPIAVAINAVASSTSVQYGWFQYQGMATVLKTAVAVTPNVVIYASGTAGRFKVLTSAGGQILGARTMNSTTVTSTTSSVLVYINRPMMQGQIT